MFVNWIHGSSQLCPKLSVEQVLICEDVIRSLLNIMCLHDVSSFILSRPHTKETWGSDSENEPFKIHLPHVDHIVEGETLLPTFIVWLECTRLCCVCSPGGAAKITLSFENLKTLVTQRCRSNKTFLNLYS